MNNNEVSHSSLGTNADAANSDFVNVTPDGGVVKRIITKGIGELPPPESTCFLYYSGRLADSNTVFDSVCNRNDRTDQFSFELGTGHVIRGLEEGVASMQRGEVCVLRITPEYGFGKLGCPPRIPGNAKLEFEVELVSYERKQVPVSQLKSLDERITESNKDKQEGNDHFKLGTYRKASKSYNKALSYLKGLYGLTEEEEKQVSAVQLTLYNNLATSHIKLDEISKAIKYAEMALAIDNKNAKAYRRLAEALEASGELSLARSKMHHACLCDPKNKELRTALEALTRKEQEAKEKMRSESSFSGMFNK